MIDWKEFLARWHESSEPEPGDVYGLLAAEVAAERERCAKLCDEVASDCEREAFRDRTPGRPFRGVAMAFREAAEVIRQG